MKRMIIGLLAGTMIFSSAACSSSEGVKNGTAQAALAGNAGQPHYKIFLAVAYLLCEILHKISHIFPAKG